MIFFWVRQKFWGLASIAGRKDWLLFYAVIRRLSLNCWASVNERRSLSIFETCMYLKSVDKNLHLKSKGNAEKLPSWSTTETVAGKRYYLVEVATFKYLWLSNRQCPIHIKCRKHLITFEYQMFLKQGVLKQVKYVS